MNPADSWRDASTAERLGLLAARPILRGLAVPVLEEIDAALESAHVPGGACVVRQGQTDVPLVFVVRGGLRASFADAKGRRHATFEYFSGATVGEALVLGDQPSPLDLHAIRDSHLLYLQPHRFRALALRHPELCLSFARLVASHMVELSGARESLESLSLSTDRLPRSVAVLTSGAPHVRRTRDLLLDALSDARATVRLGVHDAREAMEGRFRATADLVVLECEPQDGAWLDFALRQADRILVLLDDEEFRRSGRETEVWHDAKLGERPVHVELGIVHRQGTELPRAGSAYGTLPGVARRHHVRGADARDAERLARWLLDRPVGLVLGGGGAYGIAHVGVLKALEEANVPVDSVGGTSMGAIFAGGLARGWSADRIMDQVRTLFSSPLALYDPTVPYTSLLAGKKLGRIMEEFFGNVDIADLWIPFFCVATNISRARPEVHDHGSLRDAIRSSCSIPGLFPPFKDHFEDHDELLVDGGLVNNLPIDVMTERCPGPLVAVDVFPYTRPEHEAERAPRNGSQRLRGRPRQPPRLRFPLFNILTRSTFVGSARATEASLSAHPPALYLVPRLEGFRILEWRAYEAIFEAGYVCARRQLEAGALPRSQWEGRVRDAAR